MSGRNWRDAGAYAELASLDAAGFAWEFLKRNPEFIADLRRLRKLERRRPLTRQERDEFARRWGVRSRWP